MKKHEPVYDYDMFTGKAWEGTKKGIKDIRKESGMSRADFCKKLGISVDSYKSYSCGRRKYKALSSIA